MMLDFGSAQASLAVTSAEVDSSWVSRTSPRWNRAWSHPAVAIRLTEFTLAIARSCMTRGSRTVCPEDRWKKFLSLIADTAEAMESFNSVDGA
jgi:hypothetical protein